MSTIKHSDKQQLELYVKRVRELVECRVIKEGKFNYRFKFSANFETDLAEVTHEMPDEDDLRSVLLTFRLFIANKEPIYFHKIRNVAYKLLRTDLSEQRTFLEEYKRYWNTVMSNNDVQTVGSDKELTSEDILKIYINGKYFHNVLEYQQELERFEESRVRLDKMSFFITIIDLTKVIFNLGGFVEKGLAENWFEFDDEAE